LGRAAAGRLGFDAIGTHWRIDIGSRPPAVSWQTLREMVLERIGRFDRTYSRFRPDSSVTAISRQPGTYRLPDDAAPMLRLYRELYALSDGAVTPLIGGLLADAGYDDTYSLRPGVLRPVPAWDEVMEYREPELLIRRPVLLDFGACGKGYIVDLVARMLSEAGCGDVCVDAGGDIAWHPATTGAAGLRIGLEHPEDASQVIGVAEVAAGALCGSAGNRRSWDRFHHIMDPRSLESPRHIRALWVTADTALLADALTTALYFVSPGPLMERYTFEYAILYDDYRLESSPGFPATFFVSGGEGG